MYAVSMAVRAYNESSYKLEVRDLPDGFLFISSFKANYSFSTNHEYQLIVISRAFFEPEKLLNKFTRLTIFDDSNNKYAHGIISRVGISRSDLRASDYSYEIILSSQLQPLTQNKHDWVYSNRTVVEIVSDVLQRAGWVKSQFKFKLRASYEPIDFVMQYHETDLEFIERLISRYGIFYRFDYTKETYFLIFYDNVHDVSSIKYQLEFHQEIGANRTIESVYHFESKVRAIKDHVRLKAYNYEAPYDPLEVVTQNSTDTPGIGELYLYCLNYKDQATGQIMAEAYQIALDAKRHIYIAKTDSRKVQLGDVLTLSEHKNPEFNCSYRVINVEISADQSLDNPTYAATLTMIKSHLGYKTYPVKAKPFYNVMAAEIAGHKKKMVHLDEHGRYYLRFSFEADEPKNFYGFAARALQPYGCYRKNGVARGMHFPLTVGNKVGVGFINGDLDQPLILGVINTLDNLSPVNMYNKNQNILRTFSGHEFIMDDDPSNPHILLATKEHKNMVKLDASLGKNSTLLQSAGDVNIEAEKNINIKTTKNYLITAEQDQRKHIGNNYQLVTKAGSILHKAKQDLILNAQQNLICTAENQININSKETVNYQIEDSYDLQAEDLIIRVDDMAIDTDDLVLRGDQELYIGNDLGGITLTTNGISIKGTKIIFDCDTINCYEAPSAPIVPLKTQSKKNTPKQKYWLKLAYLSDTKLKPASASFNLLTAKQHPSFFYQDVGSVSVEPQEQPQQLQIDNVEIAQIGTQRTPYPSDYTKIQTVDFIKATKSALPDEDLKPDDKMVTAKILFPPMIINLRGDNPNTQLSQEQIQYIKDCGNNITIFIHGYNIEEGAYACHFSDIIKKRVGLNIVFSPQLSNTRSTIYRDLEMLKKKFPDLDDMNMIEWDNSPSSIHNLNGTEAHSWFIHMEDNLNRATGHFDRTDYSKYTRLLYVAWPGDVLGGIGFNMAEDNADIAGTSIVKTIRQLSAAGIQINIIAHSLGCRVLLKAMDILGENEEIEILNDVFLWEAAVPQTALSNKPRKDKSLRGNAKFINAHKSAKKITVLYSKYDKVLTKLYKLDKSIVDLIGTEEHVSMNTASKRQKKSIVYPALGAEGPDRKDGFIKKLIKQKKIICVNCSDLIKSHSAMKQPTPDYSGSFV